MMQASWRHKSKLKIQKQPNRWSCLPTAFAMCLDVPINKLISEIGHDGSEILFPNKSEPLCYRGFTPQELYKVCLNYNYSVIPFEKKILLEDHQIGDDSDYINQLMQRSIGVIGGVFKDQNTTHAVAWDGKMILDPMDYVYSLEYFEIHVYYLILKVEGHHDAISKED